MAFEITEQSIIEQSPNEKALLDARELIRTGALKNLAKTADGSLVFGDCRGSSGAPYTVSMDLASGTDKPTLRCSCPSRQRPCKHILGLMLVYVQPGATFSVTAAPRELLDKRAKQAEQAIAKTRTTKDAPRNVNKSALAKKAKEQIDALETLGTFLVDLVNIGVGGITPKIIEEIDQQAKRMADTNIFVAAPILKRLSAAVSQHDDSVDDDDDDDADKTEKKAARSLSTETEARVAWMITHLHAMVRRGTKLLDGRLASEGSSAAELDATYDLILSKRWQLPDLKQAGYWATNRTLLELSHERRDFDELEFAEATGFLIDLGDGSIVREWTALPYNVLKFQKLRVSRRGTLVISEAGLYPGEMVNRRIRWDEKTEGICNERTRQESDYEALHTHAKPIDAVIKAFRAHLRNPLHPLEAVFLVAATRFGSIGTDLIVEDAAKDRLVMRDMHGAIVSATTALRQAAAAYGPGSLAVRLHFDLSSRTICGEPLALFVGDEHLRLHA
jgi:hypothetical protein